MKPMGCHEQERPELTSNTGAAFDWLDDPISSFLAAEVDITAAGGGYGWWPSPAAAAQPQDDIGSVVAQALSPPAPPPPPLAHASPSISSPAASSPSEPASSTKKRKSGGGHGSSNQRRRAEHDRPGGGGGKKGGGSKGSGGAGSDRDTRWAEQLLNPCAAAVESGNLSRAQHLLYVLGELASFSGDANHRLAAHGLHALSRRLPAAVGPAAAATVRVPPPYDRPAPAAFTGAEPRLFRAALIKFHEVSPWFALPNALANAAIAHQASAAESRRRPLHVVDLGVSHGVQWPTLLESLTRLPGGRAPPSVRLTVVAAEGTSATPFSAAPPGYDFSPHLLRYAKSINLPLAITRASSLDTVAAHGGGGEEALVVCLQFRLGHAGGDERAETLVKVRGLNPELVVLSELDAGGGDGTAAGEFAARLEMLWRFLESTAAAFKGRDGEERRLLEAEAGTSVTVEAAAAGEGREAWRERMAAAGFEEAVFGDEAVESARSLLRKYDGGWEMAAATGAAAGKAVALRWKGQPVSFCSLWRPASSG
ncbi:unnamed protein product [Urochloa humidicola]